jgi:hypothetical protein
MNMSMPKLIKNDWQREPGEPFARVNILRHDIHPEGLDVNRFRFFETGSLTPDPRVGHIISVTRGEVGLHLAGNHHQDLYLQAGVHLYIPPGLESILHGEAETELVQVASAQASQARGNKLLIRNEKFVSACAVGNQSLRWILTSQFLSRRIFLHHDPTLLSKSGNPVSWYRTTMFDVAGLPKNQDGEPVFKMSYNSRTEFNVCYDVKGTARVRMAQHPYKKVGQEWSMWFPLDGDSTYHLNEVACGPEEECYIDNTTQSPKFLRNKHEVYIADGHVSLFCLFDPAPTGIELHRPGEYSDYEPLSQVLGTAMYKAHQREITKYDAMVDQFSLAKAMGELSKYHGTPTWELYLKGRETQLAVEAELAQTLIAEGCGREQVIAEWMQYIAKAA